MHEELKKQLNDLHVTFFAQQQVWHHAWKPGESKILWWTTLDGVIQEKRFPYTTPAEEILNFAHSLNQSQIWDKKPKFKVGDRVLLDWKRDRGERVVEKVEGLEYLLRSQNNSIAIFNVCDVDLKLGAKLVEEKIASLLVG